MKSCKKKKIDMFTKKALRYIKKYHDQFVNIEDVSVKTLARMLRKAYNDGLRKYE